MRTLSFEAIENARELGGLKTRDGRIIRRGMLIRCGNLSRATDADVERLLREFSLSDVVDFRFPAEAGRDPDRIIPGVRYTALNTLPQRMIDGFSQGRVEGEQPTNEEFVAQLIHHATNPAAQELARQMYPAILMDLRSQQYYGEFLRTVLNAKGGALWHCSQGKDRAGLGTAFLLTALGVDRETIIDDFDLSNKGFAEPLALLSQKVRDMGGDQDALDFIQAMVGVSKKNFTRGLALVDSFFGSVDSYIRHQLGFSASEQERLREKYLQ